MQLDPVTHIARDARILIVDDRPDNTTILSQILGRAGYAICVSITNPAEALANFVDLQPDLILLDWHMFPISGLDFIEDLKNRIAPEDMPPIIVFTADSSQETRREALAVGAADFLAKPIDPSEILLRIRNQLEMHRVRRLLRDSRMELETRAAEHTTELERTISSLRASRRSPVRHRTVKH